MSKEVQKQINGRDPDATLVKPFFSEASEETARPVVPLSPEGGPGETAAGVYVPVPPYATARRGDGRRAVWALVLVSLLTGLAAGFVGRMIYQMSRAGEERPAVAEQTPAAPDASQTAPPMTTEPAGESATSTSEPAPPPLVDARDGSRKDEKIQSQTSTDARRTDDKGAATNDDRRDNGRAASTRAPRVDDGGEDRRGRRNESEEAERRRPTPPGVYDTQGSSPEGSEAERRAEREEQRLRRAERQRRREERRRRREGGEERAVDSVRGIFEGQPPE